MTAKEYLLAIRGQRDLLKQANEDYLEAVAKATSISSALSGNVHGSEINDISSKLVSMDRFAVKRKREAERLEAAWQEAYDRIMQLPDTRQQSLLIRYYLRGESFEQVAVGMAYSWRQVMRLHGGALKAFSEIHKTWLKMA